MTTRPRLERDLPLILGDLAVGPYPDYIDDVLAATGRRRQRPAWTFLEWWLPVDDARDRVRTSRAPWRAIATIALVGLMLATALAVYVGTQRQRLPDPFGLAASCGVAIKEGDTIAIADPGSDIRNVVYRSGPGEVTLDGIVSPDGTRVAIVGGELGVSETVSVVPIAGGPPVMVRGGPFAGLRFVDWAPDSQELAITSRIPDADGFASDRLTIARSDGSGFRVVPTDFPVSDVHFRPPDGRELLVRSALGKTVALYVIDQQGMVLRTLVEPFASDDPNGDYSTNYSPDGASLAFRRWDPATRTYRAYVAPADRIDEAVEVDPDPDVWYTSEPLWSNAGDRMLVWRRHGQAGTGGPAYLAIVDARTLKAEELGQQVPEDGSAMWAPDDRTILFLAGTPGARHQIVDPVTGTFRDAPWSAANYPSWRRCAR